MSVARFVDVREVRPESLVVGLPDTGLVGVISASHMIRELGMEEVAYLESELLPPLVVIHDGEPKHPVRIFHRDGIAVVVSEIALPPNIVAPISSALFEWARSHRVKVIYSITGLAVPNRLDIEKPRVYGVSVPVELMERLRDAGVEQLKEGMLVGVHALLLRDSSKHGIDNVVLLAESHYAYPDPGAAASILECLGKHLGFEVNLKPLLEQAEEIRVKARDLMRRTAQMMQMMEKMKEREVPLLYYR